MSERALEMVEDGLARFGIASLLLRVMSAALRRMHEERLVLVDRQVVIVPDLDEVRRRLPHTGMGTVKVGQEAGRLPVGG